MAHLKWMCVLIFYGVLNVQCEQLLDEKYTQQIDAVLNNINSAPNKVYQYKYKSLVDAQQKGNIVELKLDFDYDCLLEYPEIPCTPNTVTCESYVRFNEETNTSEILGEVRCKPKQNLEEIVSNPPTTSDIAIPESPEQLVPEKEEEVQLSQETVTAPSGESFIAVRRESSPCVGCAIDLNVNVEGISTLVDTAIQHIESEKEQKHVLMKILRAQQQVVAGIKYILLLEIAPTYCPKNVDQSKISGCSLDMDNVLICEVTYLQQPWISIAKHIISNNCTRTQEFTERDVLNLNSIPRNDLDNEIDVNNKYTKFQPGIKEKIENTPNYDRIAETGRFEEMTPSRLADLESQILAESPKTSNNDDYYPIISSSPTFISEIAATEDNPHSAIVGSTEQGTSPQRAVQETSTEKVETSESVLPQNNIDTVQLNEGIDTVQTTETNPEETLLSEAKTEEYIEPVPPVIEDALEPQIDTQHLLIEKFVFDDELPLSSSTTEQPESNSSSSEEGNSSEENSVKKLDSSEEVKARKKRSIAQLEKISPDEKPLVRDLADFAAATLDNIDDDNHKRVVLQILGAKKMRANGVYYHLILRLGISHCPEDKQAGVTEDCREKLFENLTKICKVQVHVTDDLSSPKIAKSQCQNIKRDKYDRNRTNYSRYKRGLVGGHESIDKNSPKIAELLQQGLERLDQSSTNANKLKVSEILSATSQVVAGVNYEIEAKIKESNCAKNDVQALESCGFLEGSQEKICKIKVWERVWLNERKYTIVCDGDESKKIEFTTNSKRTKRTIPGGIAEESVDNPKVQQYLEPTLLHLDSVSSHGNKYKVKRVISVSKQIVAGQLWTIKAEVILSDCAKTESKNSKDCGELGGAQEKVCEIKVWDQPWIKNGRETNITCENEQYSFRAKRDVYSTKKNDYDSEHFLFKQFNHKHGKVYSSKREFKYRLKVFKQNLKFIRILNTYEEGTAKYGVTRFADLTRKEFSTYYLGLRPDLRSENDVGMTQAEIPDVELPDEFDWRDKGVVLGVKNQGQCGSCWAFSVTGNVEGQYAIKHGKLLEFSEQELVDCDSVDEGCNGGLMDNAYKAIEQLGGLETEDDYPYDAEDEKCHFNQSLAKVQVTGAVNISTDETDMAKWLVKNGPISIAINANAMQFYVGGVSHPWKFLCNPRSLDHGVLIVGYGVHTYPYFKKSLPYWIVKNSWGPSWGEQGFYRVYRGDGTCGVNQTPSSAIVE